MSNIDKVLFLNLQKLHEPIAADVSAAMSEVIASGAFVLGPDVGQFEAAFAGYCGSKRAVGVASGLDALVLALRGYDIGTGDEVILPANTFIATALAVSAVGATPILVDCDERTWNLDLTQTAAVITDRTKAIMPVHLYGLPVDMDAVRQIVGDRDIRIIEDASQAHGATQNNRRTGSLGDCAGFSLYPGKNLGAYGQAGVLTTDDEALADRIAELRNYGSNRKYYHDSMGCNSRLDTLQAAVLNVKLAKLDEWNFRRQCNAAIYHDKLAGVGDLQLPFVPEGFTHVYHQFVVRTSRRDELLEYLQSNDVGSMIHYPVPLHLQKAYAGMSWEEGDFPVSEMLATQILSLPICPTLGQADIEHVVETIKKFY
jgi:dTDP-4-amino-4,6-dideoxygalactose transaminase